MFLTVRTTTVEVEWSAVNSKEAESNFDLF